MDQKNKKTHETIQRIQNSYDKTIKDFILFLTASFALLQRIEILCHPPVIYLKQFSSFTQLVLVFGVSLISSVLWLLLTYIIWLLLTTHNRYVNYGMQLIIFLLSPRFKLKIIEVSTCRLIKRLVRTLNSEKLIIEKKAPLI